VRFRRQHRADAEETGRQAVALYLHPLGGYRCLHTGRRYELLPVTGPEPQ
jgi:hypothetical protein